jgi:ribonuclease BN (tRNA processing enzyme)
MRERFDFKVYPGEHFSIGPFSVRTTKADHPQPAISLRLTDGSRSLVYSGDTGTQSALVDLAKDCDLLLAEAAFLERQDNPNHMHMTGREAAETAERARAGRLVLTHIPPWYSPDDVLAQARPHFSGPIEFAKAGARFQV